MTGTDQPRVWDLPADWRTATCRCGHVGDDHDAGECWALVYDGDGLLGELGSQCPCSWLEFTDATEPAVGTAQTGDGQ